ncbi:alpha/beta fold hydrolase [Arcticibacter eurypsychrophilus]|uniref:alpha/beta fold hydrolase n=1 Tax=Arcticibacter eurypsychrophilus TaxID=1434752 RepID=UPI00084D6F40|nr:alpha/beta fold hydrolase [Arcticibacter eurypsychrophilus]
MTFNRLIVLILILSSSVLLKAADLPLKVIPATHTNAKLPMVFFISGDGGWNSFSQKLAETFAAKGYPVVALDAKKYFWDEKSPDQTTLEISEVINRYMRLWKKDTFLLTGFSFGGSIVPFVARRLPENLKASLTGLSMISAEPRADFEVSVSGMLNMKASGKYDVLAELKKIKSMKALCFFGTLENAGITKEFRNAGNRVVTLKGNHYYNNDQLLLANTIINDIN